MHRILTGDCQKLMQSLPEKSVHTCITSPPYFGLRDYGMDDQIGLENTPDAYVSRLVSVFRDVHRVLRDDGTLWLNLGDSYNSGPSGGLSGSTLGGGKENQAQSNPSLGRKQQGCVAGLKHKDLIGIPWRVAFALQQDGWYLRQDIIWHKPNPMPESVRDRCTKAHEYIFLLSKSPRYYFDAEAIKEPAITAGDTRHLRTDNTASARLSPSGRKKNGSPQAETRNKRSVWTVTPKPFKGAHFATFPPDLIEPCILSGCPVGGIVLDPFGGSGTTGLVASRLNRNAILCELNPAYVEIARNRLMDENQ